MGLFNFFKKKPEASNDTLSLEALLQKAATEPAFRAQFTQRLLTDNLVVITEGDDRSNGQQILKENSTINIIHLGDGRIPVFTSTDRIFDQGIIKEQVHFTAMKGRDLFELTRGATLFINPYSAYGKEMLADEIAHLLDGSLGTSKKITIEKAMNVLIGQPANYPDALVASLKKLFSERPNVNAAYLGWISNPESGDPPHLIFSLDADGDHQSICDETGFTAQQILGPHEIIDIVKFGQGTLDDYFKNIAPFYKR